MKPKEDFKVAMLHKEEDGYHTFRCPKGLWAVSHHDFDKGVAEALHYYQQYAMDGEYDEAQ